MATFCEKCRCVQDKKGQRFCKACEAIIRGQMKASGYLAPRTFGHVGTQRTTDQRENVRDTKFGRDG